MSFFRFVLILSPTSVSFTLSPCLPSAIKRGGTLVETHVEYEDAKPRFLPFPSELLPCCLNIFLKLSDGVFQGSARVIHLVNDQYVLAD